MRVSELARRILCSLRLRWRMFLWRFSRRIRNSVTVRTEQGNFTVACADEGIGKPVYCNRQYEMDLLMKAAALVHRLGGTPAAVQATVVDIGANMGITSISLLRSGLMQLAIAIEPDPMNFSLLQNNVRQNKLDGRVICLPYAVLDKRGRVQFELSRTNHGDHRVRSARVASNHAELFHESDRCTIEVDAETLDTLVLNLPKQFTEQITLVWIDIQGFEGYAFLGGKRLLANRVPAVAEIWPYGIRRSGMSRDAFCEIVASIWDTCWIMSNGEFRRNPVGALRALFDDLGYEGKHTNIVLTSDLQ
jgi:FkbM family methyltransferase